VETGIDQKRRYGRGILVYLLEKRRGPFVFARKGKKDPSPVWPKRKKPPTPESVLSHHLQGKREKVF